MKVKQLQNLLAQLGPDVNIHFCDFKEISSGEKAEEYKIEWFETTKVIYSDGHGNSEKVKIYLTKTNKYPK